MEVAKDMNELTQVKNHTSVGIVRRHFLKVDRAKHMNELTQVKNHTSVGILRRHLLKMETAKRMKEFILIPTDKLNERKVIYLLL